MAHHGHSPRGSRARHARGKQRAGAARFVPAANGGLDLGVKLVRASDEDPERVVTVRIAP